MTCDLYFSPAGNEKYCKLVVVFLVSGFDQETQRTQFSTVIYYTLDLINCM